MLFIGIDPGRQGSLCLLDHHDHIIFLDLNPDKHTARNLVDTLHTFSNVCNVEVHIALELVHSLYGMSAKSNFTFGGMFWRARTILDCLNKPYELVTPKIWQQAVGVPPKKDRAQIGLKELVATLAHNLYPNAQLWGPRGGLLDGRSDALMIAHYLKLKHPGEI